MELTAAVCEVRSQIFHAPLSLRYLFGRAYDAGLRVLFLVAVPHA